MKFFDENAEPRWPFYVAFLLAALFTVPFMALAYHFSVWCDTYLGKLFGN